MLRPLGESPETLMTGLALLRSRTLSEPAEELMVGVKARLSFTTVMALAAVSTTALVAVGVP